MLCCWFFIISLQMGDRVSAAAIEDVEAAVTSSITMDSVEKSTDRMLKSFTALMPVIMKALFSTHL